MRSSQSLSQRRPAHAELFREVHFVDALAGREAAVDDHVPQFDGHRVADVAANDCESCTSHTVYNNTAAILNLPSPTALFRSYSGRAKRSRSPSTPSHLSEHGTAKGTRAPSANRPARRATMPQVPVGRLHPDRAARRHRHHRYSGCHPLSRLRPGARKGPRHRLPEPT